MLWRDRLCSSGYPKGKRGFRISQFAKMVAIVDMYDAMTTGRIYRTARSPLDALQLLYELRGKALDEELVEQFIQCLGLYPIGSIVELESGEVGIVASVDRARRLRPKIMMVLDGDKKPYEKPFLADLMTQTVDASGKPYNIRTVREGGAYGIEIKDYMEKFLFPGAVGTSLT